MILRYLTAFTVAVIGIIMLGIVWDIFFGYFPHTSVWFKIVMGGLSVLLTVYTFATVDEMLNG